MRTILSTLAAVGLASAASAQVDFFVGPSPNLTTAIDFDNPAAPIGPISSTDPLFTGNGISSISVVGTWGIAGDTLTTGSNVNGSALIVQGGGLAVDAAGGPLDGANAGDGFDIELSSPVDEFQALFADQVNMSYDVELFLAGTSLGVGNFVYSGAFPNPPHYWRGPSMFDRIVITFPVGSGGVGLDELALGDGPGPPPPPPIPDECLETLIAGGNGGNAGGAVYFDLTTTQTVTFSGIMTHTGAAIGTPVGLEVWVTPGSSAGVETDPTVWTMVAQDDGNSLSEGLGVLTELTFTAPWSLPAGTVGVALVGLNTTTGAMLNHTYTNGNGANQAFTSGDSVLSAALGRASNTAFTAPLFDPRVWNGMLCHGAGSLGTNYCSANPNSTGGTATINATGDPVAANNAVALEATGLPANQFGIFIWSPNQGFIPMPGGSAGNLCLSSPIGRYNPPSGYPVLDSGAAGEFTLSIDLTNTPTPMGNIAVTSGQTMNFQAWHRDLVGGTPVSNFTDGTSVLLQ